MWNRSILSSHKISEIESRSRCSPAPRFNPTNTASPARLRWCSQVASASASDSLNCAVSGASSGRGEGRNIKDALLARETVEQVDDFAGRVKAKRVELAPRTTLSSLADRLNDGRLPDGEVGRQSGERDPQAVRGGFVISEASLAMVTRLERLRRRSGLERGRISGDLQHVVFAQLAHHLRHEGGPLALAGARLHVVHLPHEVAR